MSDSFENWFFPETYMMPGIGKLNRMTGVGKVNRSLPFVILDLNFVIGRP